MEISSTFFNDFRYGSLAWRKSHNSFDAGRATISIPVNQQVVGQELFYKQYRICVGIELHGVRLTNVRHASSARAWNGKTPTPTTSSKDLVWLLVAWNRQLCNCRQHSPHHPKRDEQTVQQCISSLQERAQERNPFAMPMVNQLEANLQFREHSPLVYSRLDIWYLYGKFIRQSLIAGDVMIIPASTRVYRHYRFCWYRDFL